MRYRSIDSLRGVAILAVLIHHLPYAHQLLVASTAKATTRTSVISHEAEKWLALGRWGVMLFLVISGFCIHLRWAKTGDMSARIGFWAFWKRRLARLYPPYLLAVILSVFGLFLYFNVLGTPAAEVFAGRFGYTSNSLFAKDMASLLLMVQNIGDAPQRVGNGPFWSLALEEQLYLMYFPLLWIRQRLGWAKTLAICAAVNCAWLVSLTLLQDMTLARTGPSYWAVWALGAISVEAAYRRVTLPRPLRSLLLGVVVMVVAACGEVMWSLPWELPTFIFCFGCFLLINACMRFEQSREGAFSGPLAVMLARIGVWSYSLYLTHQPIFQIGKQLGLRLGLPVWGVLLLRIGLAFAGGIFYFYAIERPVIAWAKTIGERHLLKRDPVDQEALS